jgi:rubrerythrin
VDETRTDDDEPEEWRGERLRAHREALEVRRARQATATRVFAAALAAALLAGVGFRLPESWWVPAIGGIAALALVFRLANWKCPSCGERLGGRGSSTRCPGCGAPID